MKEQIYERTNIYENMNERRKETFNVEANTESQFISTHKLH